MVVKSAFLNGYINEEVYIEQPKGFVALYGLNRHLEYGMRDSHSFLSIKGTWKEE
jgi:hypothetical protein